MRKLRYTNYGLVLLWLAVSVSACFQDNPDEIVVSDDPGLTGAEIENKYADFDFKTVQEYNLTLTALDLTNNPLDGVYIELYTRYPLDPNGVLAEDAAPKRVYSGVTNAEGLLRALINPPTTVDSLYILPHFIGLDPLYVIPLDHEEIRMTIGGAIEAEDGLVQGEVRSFNNPPPVRKRNGFYILGLWNHHGRPNYLEKTDDVISADFLYEVNASLPERSRLPESHPQYLANDDDANLQLIEDAEVFVTFVHEGAGYRNTLGYYTYPTDNPPQSASDLEDLTIIFPDVSRTSRTLQPGNKVQLYYLDPETNAYTNVFPEGTTVGWFLIPNGWWNLNNTKFYSNPQFNPEPLPEQRKHNVLLYDAKRERLLLGFEDLERNGGSDDDFNDAVFYSSVTPFTAVDHSIYQPVDDNIDDDGDGVSDIFDDFPDDPSRAFNNPYPGEDTYATLVFEDLWPSRGDYDFNDLVVDYQYNPVTNGQNDVVSIQAKIRLKAIGASYHNAFGIQLNVPPSRIASINGQRIEENYLSLAANGTEQNQSKAVVFYFDNAYRVLQHPGIGIGVNTEQDAPYVQPVEFTVDIAFTQPVSINQLGPPPYNPFIVVNRQRGIEIHLPGQEPTDLADTSLFGTGDDDSEMGTDKNYMSDEYLPWGLNIPSDWEYPKEKRVITRTYLKFDEWAISRGNQFADWYEERADYKNPNFVYRRQ